MPKKSIIAILLALFTPIPAYAHYVASELIEAAQNGQAEKVQALLEAGADVNAKGENGMMPLMWAALGGDAETVQVLLDGGLDEEKTQQEILQFIRPDGHLALPVVLKKSNPDAINTVKLTPASLFQVKDTADRAFTPCADVVEGNQVIEASRCSGGAPHPRPSH